MLRPRQFREVEDIMLILSRKLQVCTQCVVPRLAVFVILDHLEVELFLALERRLSREARIDQRVNNGGWIPLVELAMQA